MFCQEGMLLNCYVFLDIFLSFFVVARNRVSETGESVKTSPDGFIGWSKCIPGIEIIIIL
jgi:hypothetical protein